MLQHTSRFHSLSFQSSLTLAKVRKDSYSRSFWTVSKFLRSPPVFLAVLHISSASIRQWVGIAISCVQKSFPSFASRTTLRSMLNPFQRHNHFAYCCAWFITYHKMKWNDMPRVPWHNRPNSADSPIIWALTLLNDSVTRSCRTTLTSIKCLCMSLLKTEFWRFSRHVLMFCDHHVNSTWLQLHVLVHGLPWHTDWYTFFAWPLCTVPASSFKMSYLQLSTLVWRDQEQKRTNER